MSHGQPSYNPLVEDLAREVIAEVAPEELDLFDELSQEYRANPQPPSQSGKALDDALGFGLGDVLIASTPAANAMIGVVVAFAGQIIISYAQDKGKDFVEETLKSLFKRGKKPTEPPPVQFSQDQLRQMRDAAESEARRFGLSEHEAQAMADALFRRMVLGQ
jgi:hypothetical protein